MEDELSSIKQLHFLLRDQNGLKETLPAPRDSTKQIGPHIQSARTIQRDENTRQILQRRSSLETLSHRTPSQDNHPATRHSTLPSIFLKKNGKSSYEAGSLDNNGSEESPSGLSAYKTFGIYIPENMTTVSNAGDMQSLGSKHGKKFLAPLVDPKQHSQRGLRERTNSSPEVSSQIFKHKAQKDYPTTQGFMSNEHGFTDIQKLRAQVQDSLKTTDNVAAPGPVDSFEERNFLSLPPKQQRRFSAPLSPRFIRKLIPERFYSSTDTSDSQSHTRENGQRAPGRETIFSPPAKEFDAISDEDKKNGGRDTGAFQKPFLQENTASKTVNKSLDIDLRSNSTRFLSDIRVSFSDITQPKNRSSKGDRRKHSYNAISASSEALLSDSALPPVRVTMADHEQSERNRALSTSSCGVIGSRQDRDRAFDSPIFLEPETRGLSHLNLSPRLPRKF